MSIKSNSNVWASWVEVNLVDTRYKVTAGYREHLLFTEWHRGDITANEYREVKNRLTQQVLDKCEMLFPFDDQQVNVS